MEADEIPDELVARLDTAAGKQHGKDGPVLAALAEILTMHAASIGDPAGIIDRYTRRLWHTSQHNRCAIFIGGRVQDDVNGLRAAVGLPEFGWNDSVPDEDVERCSVHTDDDCKGQHTHNPPVPGRREH